MPMKKVSAEKAKVLRGATKWQQVKAMTEEDIQRSIRLDSDAPELNAAGWKRFRLNDLAKK